MHGECKFLVDWFTGLATGRGRGVQEFVTRVAASNVRYRENTEIVGDPQIPGVRLQSGSWRRDVHTYLSLNYHIAQIALCLFYI